MSEKPDAVMKTATRHKIRLEKNSGIFILEHCSTSPGRKKAPQMFARLKSKLPSAYSLVVICNANIEI